jgi:Flp pilus assembly pilin Flp
MRNSEIQSQTTDVSEYQITSCAGHSDRGATSIEYALIASLIAAFIAGAVLALGLNVLDLFTSVVW